MKKRLLQLGSIAATVTATSQAAMVAHWKIDEGTGSTTIEQVTSTVSADIGAATWSPTAAAPGNVNSLQFNNVGVSTNLNAATVGIAGSNAKTIVTWFNTTTTAQDGFFGYSPTNGGIAGADLRMLVNGNGGDTTGKLRIEVNAGGFEIGSGLNDGNWHMVAMVINGGDRVNDIDVYIDGTYTSRSSGGTGTVLNTAGTGANFQLGSDGNAGRAFTGRLDQVMIYDEALTEAQLNALAIPEPAAAILGGLGLLGMLRRRRG